MPKTKQRVNQNIEMEIFKHVTRHVQSTLQKYISFVWTFWSLCLTNTFEINIFYQKSIFDLAIAIIIDVMRQIWLCNLTTFWGLSPRTLVKNAGKTKVVECFKIFCYGRNIACCMKWQTRKPRIHHRRLLLIEDKKSKKNLIFWQMFFSM